jgi:hypothetical protein
MARIQRRCIIFVRRNKATALNARPPETESHLIPDF